MVSIATSQFGRARPEYDVRPFEPDDRAGFLSLYESVWGRPKGDDWFEWRFEDVPVGSGVEMVVATANGELVGAEPLLPFRLRMGERTVEAAQPVDWIVHPDHRRRGLFTRMTETLLERYADGPAAFLFNFPTAALLPGLKQFDWRVVAEVSTYYRIQDPLPLVDTKAGVTHPLATTLSRCCYPIYHGYQEGRDGLVRRGIDAGLTVERSVDEVPPALLASVAASSVSDRLHLARDEDFYAWRFDNPDWETTTYVARRNGTPVASVVAVTQEVHGVRSTILADVQPQWDGWVDVDSPADADRRGAFDALLAAVVEDHDDADVLKASDDVLPASVLAHWGFHSDGSMLLSKLAHGTTHVVRPFDVDDPSAWTVGGRDLADPETWGLSMAGQDIA